MNMYKLLEMSCIKKFNAAGMYNLKSNRAIKNIFFFQLLENKICGQAVSHSIYVAQHNSDDICGAKALHMTSSV